MALMVTSTNICAQAMGLLMLSLNMPAQVNIGPCAAAVCALIVVCNKFSHRKFLTVISSLRPVQDKIAQLLLAVLHLCSSSAPKHQRTIHADAQSDLKTHRPNRRPPEQVDHLNGQYSIT